MRHLCLALVATLFSCAINSPSFAAAYQFYELGTPVIGTAGVGQAALANDASTTYFNPAGMGLLHGSQFMVGSQLLIPYANFSKNDRNTIAGNNGGNAETLVPGIGLYYVFCYSPELKFGISFTSPYGGLLNYNDGWVGRFNVQFQQLYTLDLNPTVSYQINNAFSVGLGAVIEYANLHQTVALPSRISPLVDGQINVKIANLKAGFNLGAIYTPTPQTIVGIAYRSQIKHNLTGHSTFLRIGFTPSVHSQMIMPQNIILSIVQAATEKLTLLAEAGWANWSTTNDVIVNVSGFSVSNPLKWKDTYRAGLGMQYQINPCILLQSGVSYDSSPTDASHREPELPMDRQIRIGAGVIFKLMPGAAIGLSYEYINFGRAKIDNLSPLGILSGDYKRNYANVIQASINVDC